MRPTQGVSFGGRYELVSRIAIGGMGEVWEATDHVIGRTVAIKILKDEYMGDPGFLERFRAEARHAALVNHEGIASVFDYGEENGSAFLVMELVPGEALSTILERDGSLSSDKTLDIVAQTSAALQAAHAAGLVHRDIKPGNLLITPDGRVKITDFGIARIADQVPLTATGQVMGTVQYLSPEQASGHPASATTDIYSLGIVAYECLAGKRPFTGESQVAIAMAQINEQPPPLPPTIAEPVRNLVMAMIAKKPEDRPASAAAVARAASALRRGDMTAAAAAVPALAAGVASDDATQLLTPENQDDATRIMTAAGPAAAGVAAVDEEPAADADKRKRSPWTWPLVALIVLLLLVLGGTVWALLASPGGGDDPSGTPTTTEPTPEPSTPDGTPTPTTVDIDALDLDGQDCETARQTALDAGMENVSCEDGNTASSADQVGIVYDVNPVGPSVPMSTPLVLTRYAPQTEMPQPSAPTIDGGAAEVEADSTVPVNWSGYSCPSGTGAVAAYNLTAVNGLFSNGESTYVAGPSERPVDVTVGSAEGDSLIVSYTVTCAGGQSSERTSGASPEGQATIVAPENGGGDGGDTSGNGNGNGNGSGNGNSEGSGDAAGDGA
ncbi:serine/threonine protein kinase [Microbacterium sp. LRZ72]|uniref:serine/threonine-protein kinase n=1 Tax=Microbacterium sp. LRZ72 TaxID=2942481 RepID=UPI0029AF7A16|nr:serine/threonine-protein kinase [Microbacterium sp. LRZ72]MDX2376255.1 serine/threonine protein kinase [Microbacterium sp. LRZ72]